jgi:hypothetical protein
MSISLRSVVRPPLPLQSDARRFRSPRSPARIDVVELIALAEAIGFEPRGSSDSLRPVGALYWIKL